MMKLMSFINKIRVKVLSFIISKKFKNSGKNFVANPGIYLKNPKYIHVGNNCYFGRGCRIEAWDKYNDKPELFVRYRFTDKKPNKYRIS